MYSDRPFTPLPRQLLYPHWGFAQGGGLDESPGVFDPEARMQARNPAMRPPPRPVAPPPMPVRRRNSPQVVPLSPQEQQLSYSPILYGTQPHEENRNVVDIARSLQARSQAALRAAGVRGGKITGSNPQTDAMLARVMAHEISQALMRKGSAGDWYTSNVRDAMGLASMMHPEMEDNPVLEHAYKLALAVTSQGEKVWPNNTKYADRAFQVFKDTGRFPTNFKYVKGKYVNGNFQKLNDLFDKHSTEDDPQGHTGALNFLHTPFKAGELAKMGYASAKDEEVDTPVFGSQILGSKIGNGFYSNLRGIYDPTTFDMWWMRGWNRLTGHILGQPDPKAAEKTKQRYLDALGDQAPRTAARLKAMAEADWKQHQSDYRNYRSEFDSGKRVKSERVKAADRYLQSLAGMRDSPSSGGHRTWMRNVAAQAKQILAEHGHHVTNADMQALWWYPEKDLYGQSDKNVDYAQAMTNLAREKGYSDVAIAKALAASRRRPG